MPNEELNFSNILRKKNRRKWKKITLFLKQSFVISFQIFLQFPWSLLHNTFYVFKLYLNFGSEKEQFPYVVLMTWLLTNLTSNVYGKTLCARHLNHCQYNEVFEHNAY